MARVMVIGHPLAAAENRLAFSGWKNHQVSLVLPKVWNARSLGHVYRAPANSQKSSLSSEIKFGDWQGNADVSQSNVGIYSLQTFFTGRNSLFLWVGLTRLIHDLNPDIIYCWEEPWCLSTWQVRRLAQQHGIPLIFYSAENRPKSLPWPFMILLRSTFDAAKACIAPTEEIATQVHSWGFIKKVFIIPLWIPHRKQLEVNCNIKRLAFVGRLIPLKRVGLLIESLSLLPGFTLRIIGDGPEREKLGRLARTKGVEDRVDFRGHVDNAALDLALQGTSLLVLPTAENPRQAEQFGKAAVEGISYGLPVLTSRTGNLTALSIRFETLVAKDLNTPDQMAAAVLSVFLNYPDAKALGYSRTLAEESFGPISVARKFEAAISELLESQRI